jgi:hypothetical protein
MQTYKKRFRKNRTMKKQKYNQKQNKKNQILKGVVCYKIRIIPRSNGGGIFEGENFKRLEDMIRGIEKNNNYSDTFFKKFLDEILNGTTSKSKAKKQKVFNEIFNEDVFVPSDSVRDDITIKKKNENNRKHAKKVKTLLYYLNSGKDENGDVKVNPTKEDIETLKDILLRKQKADEILTDILLGLDDEAIKKQLTAGQIAAIKSKIEGTGGITGALSSVTSKISNGAVSLGNWLAPERLDDDGVKKELKNKQKIKFLWYPRKHIDYEKGASGSKRGKDDATEYGDFMIIIEPEQYASTGEFFKQTYHSVEDLLATLLMGCSKPFCLDGEVKRKPYKEYIYEITNKQPTIDRDKTGKPALVEK